MREQFFSPNKFNKDVPIKCHMTLIGEPHLNYGEETAKFWVPPFKFSIERDFCCVVVRNASIFLPLSRDPQIPIARELPFVPPRYALRPNFETFFQ
jgi:hypothetical protein